MKHCITAIVVLIFALTLSASGALRAPKDAQITRIDGEKFYSGDVYLPSVADTALLLPLGFRDFEFLGRAISTVRFRTVWPRDADLSELPDEVSGLTFDLVSAAPAEDEESYSAATVAEGSPAYNELDSESDSPGYEIIHAADPWSTYDNFFEREPILSKPMKGKAPTGTFFVEPTNDGPFSSIGSHVVKNPNVTGGFLFGTPNNAARDSWRGVTPSGPVRSPSGHEHERRYGRRGHH